MLAKYVADDDVSKWDLYVNRALFACRIREHQATGKTPFYMVYGVEAKLPGDLLTPLLDVDEPINITNRTHQINQLHEDRDITHRRLVSNAVRMKLQYDRHLRPINIDLHEGDWVLLHNNNRKKFQPHWLGP